jgi:hypothetical protein
MITSLDRTLSDGNPISALLDMIERKAPLLMRVGGGALSSDAPSTPSGELTKHEKSMITRRLHQSRPITEIAAEYDLPLIKVEAYANRVQREVWTDKDVYDLTTYYQNTPGERFSVETIAHQLDRSVLSVTKKASDLGITNAKRKKSISHRIALKAAKAIGITQA